MNEVGHFGYQIYGLKDEEWQLLTPSPIINDKSTDALAIQRYEFFYAGVVPQWFTLVDVSTAEVLTLHGPYRLNEVYGSEAKAMQPFDWNQLPSWPDAANDARAQSQLEQKINRLKNLDTQPEVYESNF